MLLPALLLSVTVCFSRCVEAQPKYYTSKQFEWTPRQTPNLKVHGDPHPIDIWGFKQMIDNGLADYSEIDLCTAPFPACGRNTKLDHQPFAGSSTVLFCDKGLSVRLANYQPEDDPQDIRIYCQHGLLMARDLIRAIENDVNGINLTKEYIPKWRVEMDAAEQFGDEFEFIGKTYWKDYKSWFVVLGHERGGCPPKSGGAAEWVRFSESTTVGGKQHRFD